MGKLASLAVVGLGNMGEALIKGILDRGLVDPPDVRGADKVRARGEEMARRYGLTLCDDAREACRGAQVVLLAVKPQDADAALAEIAPATAGNPVISVCAGIPLARLTAALSPGTPVVRAMPNTPALIGQGTTVYCANARATAEHRETARALLGAVGEVHEVGDEGLLDAVTGLSGSGPAYVFAFLEALADGGVLAGLPRALARSLACQTVVGAALLARDSGEHTAELKDRVASPAGTTIAGLRELEKGGFRAAVIEAVRAATARSRELGG
ncbi:MAG: pyrroline-5-carboxylate reductase [Deferrisomatales bacterium]